MERPKTPPPSTTPPSPITPSSPTKSTTVEERIACKTLYYHARWSYQRIAEVLGLSTRQVQYAVVAGRNTPTYRKRGRRGVLCTPQKQLILSFFDDGTPSRRLIPVSRLSEHIPGLAGYSEQAIRYALNNLGCSITRQPSTIILTATHCKNRLEFCLRYRYLTEDEWESWIWSDETWINGNSGRPKSVILLPGEKAADFAKAKTPRKQGWMF